MSTPQLIYLIAVIMVIVLIVKYWYVYYGTEYNTDRAFLDHIESKLRTVYPEYGDIQLYRGHASYTRDKKIMYLCIRDPATNQLYPEKDIIYVGLHELAHLISTSYSTNLHNEEFMTNFDMLRHRAAQLNILEYSHHVGAMHCKV